MLRLGMVLWGAYVWEEKQKEGKDRKRQARTTSQIYLFYLGMRKGWFFFNATSDMKGQGSLNLHHAGSTENQKTAVF